MRELVRSTKIYMMSTENCFTCALKVNRPILMIKLLKQIKTSILVLVAITLTIVSLIKIPTVDRIVLENDWQYPFFYASAHILVPLSSRRAISPFRKLCHRALPQLCKRRRKRR